MFATVFDATAVPFRTRVITVSGTVAVTLTTGSQAVTPTAPSDILIPETSEGVSATIGNVAVDAGKFYDFLTNEALSGMTAYATYRSTEIAAYETEIKSFITALTASGSDLITDLATVGSNGLTGTYSASGAGSAVITYSNESDDDIKLAGSSTTYVYLPAGGSMTLNLAGASGSTATADSFTVATYTLSGTFALYSDKGTTANKNFAEMTVTGLSGAATGTVNASSNNVVTGVDSFGFTDQTAGTASAQVGVGPTLAADGTNTLETVTATYTAD